MKKMRKKDPVLWQWVGFGVVSLLGTLLHFLYNRTGSTAAALISAVNESTWEHMKLLFFPMLLFAGVEYLFVGDDYENFWCIKFGGALLGLSLIPTLFYTLSGIFGRTPDWVNIAIFFAAAGLAFWEETRQFKKGSRSCKYGKLYLLLLCLLAVAFFVFTFQPPALPLFEDPVDGGFGI